MLFLILSALATGVLWVTLWGWPIIRDREYRQLVADFRHALGVPLEPPLSLPLALLTSADASDWVFR